MSTIKKLADARDVILHELTRHLSCVEVKVKSMQANNLNHVCTKTVKERLHPMLEEMFEVLVNE
ncbi:TPA: DinI family protein [Salmonella enterica]|nr:DinI family protein [Salmonella enterica subsp. salamae serovar Greenside]HAU3141918.1 DinI family protein [Salmonella enterica]